MSSENEPLILSESDEDRPTSNWNRKISNVTISVGVLFAIGLAAIAVVQLREMITLPPLAERNAGELADVSLSFQAYNEYTDIHGFAGSSYPWIAKGKLVEPFKKSTLQATAAFVDVTKVDITWKIDDDLEFEGSSFEHIFTKVGEYEIIVLAVDGNSHETISRGSDTLICRYVRREIRKLTDDDREAYFEAASVIYHTDLGTGKDQYGEKFIDIQWFAQLHNTLAGSRDCDHLHDGLGFLPQHAAFTLMYEKVLQLINPAVSIPYWDYTIEAHDVIVQASINAWRSSIVWSDDWFGDASPVNKVVEKGRFARTPIVGNARNITKTTNAYGFVRSPWNQNREKFVTRHNYTYGFTLDDAPGCKQHYDVMQETTFKDFGVLIQYAPHGTVHAMIGGVWGADFREKLLNHGYSAVHAANVGLEAFATQKNLWRAYQLECPTECSEDAPALACKCTCPNLKSWMEAGWTHDILAAVSPLFFEKSYLLNTNKHDISDIILKLMCNDFDEYNPIIGDSLESASPTDISFWNMHPTVDRLYHWKAINGFKNNTWEDNMSRSVSFQNVGYCWGHNFDDVTVWKNLFDDDDTPYSNKDLYEVFDSTKSTAMPYIYDNFEWTHCEEEGYPLALIAKNAD